MCACVCVRVQRCVRVVLIRPKCSPGFVSRVRSCARPYVIRTPTGSRLPLYQRLAGDVSCQPASQLVWLVVCLSTCLPTSSFARPSAWAVSADPSGRRASRSPASRSHYGPAASCGREQVCEFFPPEGRERTSRVDRRARNRMIRSAQMLLAPLDLGATRERLGAVVSCKLPSGR